MISLLIQLFGLAVPLCSQVIIDRVLVSADISLLKLLLLGVVFVSAFQMIAICLREYLTAHSLQRIDVSLRLQLLNHILWLPQKILSTWQVSDFALRFSESEKLMQLISKSATQMFIDSLSIFVFLIALLLMNLRLAAVVLVYVVSYGLLMLFYSSLLRAHNRQVFRSRQETESSLIESLTSIQTIKSPSLPFWGSSRLS